ncbi:MAG: hypothetical protein M0R46_04595 [Candidatus Muirbacterium halophilum]|nr:hypothetical protein [Candidatus Muirbacterium halophilum]MCK9475174.1 hypothetical protein [Candidatus Muirbacterium halophilum]
MKKLVFLCILLFVSFNSFCVVQNVDFGDIYFVEELIDNKTIRISIEYNVEYFDEIVIHYGINGWQNIFDVKVKNRLVIIDFPRNTACINFCFKVDEKWHNNYGKDWNIRLKNFLSDSIIFDLGDDIVMTDFVREKYNAICAGIDYINCNGEVSEYSRRSLNTLFDLKKFAEDILPKIMRKKDFSDRKQVERDFEYFVKMTEGI